jgi:tetratricopeptide (TPR) repeat protein
MKPYLLTFAILLLNVAVPATANTEKAAALIARGDALDAKLQSEAALVVYLEAEKLAPDNAALLIKIAKQYGESMTALGSESAKRQAGEAALAAAHRALAQAPKLADAHLAVAICYGRLLDYLPVRTQVEYSRHVHQHALQATVLAPSSDYAWHMLGRWNHAVATMGGLTRGIVSIVYGGLPDASLEQAKQCYETAMKLNPKRLCHPIELGRTLAEMKRIPEARKLLTQGLAMPDLERDDPDTKKRGREALEALGSE